MKCSQMEIRKKLNKFILGETATEAAAVTIPEPVRGLSKLTSAMTPRSPSRWRRKPLKTCGIFKFGATIYTVCTVSRIRNNSD